LAKEGDEKVRAFYDYWGKKKARHDTVLATIPKDSRFDKEAYFLTEKWKKKRDAALKRAGHRCVLCNSQEKLEVHHRTYVRLGRELCGDLIALCGECHAQFHFK
jgi:5-methylcytosine-specific restriction endonuclease McrA